MKSMRTGLLLLSRLLSAAALACACLNAYANDAFAPAKQRGKLLAGIAHVQPDYVAGAKFRTPESIDGALAEELARHLRLALGSVAATAADSERLLAAGKADVVLASIADGASPRAAVRIIPTGYTAGPMAIMRSDTNIKSWEQLKGRTVCLSSDGQYAGTIAARYGAIEKVFKAPADALLALRTGGCDAAVHDSALLEELLKLPEWKKFSARLPTGPRRSLAFIVPVNGVKEEAVLKRLASEWQASGYVNQAVNKAARSIAFEVYLDQDVPDCH